MLYWIVPVAIVLFIAGVLYLLMRKPGPPVLSHALIIPVAVTLLLFAAFTLMLLGSLTTDRHTVDFIGAEISLDALQTAATLLGVGIVTGVLAGAILGVVQRWHDYEK